jgi:hypothetical protein
MTGHSYLACPSESTFFHAKGQYKQATLLLSKQIAGNGQIWPLESVIDLLYLNWPYIILHCC